MRPIVEPKVEETRVPSQPLGNNETTPPGNPDFNFFLANKEYFEGCMDLET
jgi:hypothetical protein